MIALNAGSQEPKPVQPKCLSCLLAYCEGGKPEVLSYVGVLMYEVISLISHWFPWIKTRFPVCLSAQSLFASAARRTYIPHLFSFWVFYCLSNSAPLPDVMRPGIRNPDIP